MVSVAWEILKGTKQLFLKIYDTSEGAVSHNVLYMHKIVNDNTTNMNT